IHAIAGQQVSAAAHRAVWNRLLAAYPNPDPGTLARANPEELRECGLSRNKAVYIIGAAVRFASGEFANLERLSDEEIIAKIVSLRGAGIWTAEMTLIFTFRRRDVVSRADFGIRKGMRTVYGLEELTAEEFAKRAKNYSPLGSLASLYLWEAASGRYPGFADPAAKKVK
ncbi:MAG: hypothetical protein K2H64_03245, partial [Desulfovibrio sp.]|nr:hypothetical protein [Desulfovibrio sp.]